MLSAEVVGVEAAAEAAETVAVVGVVEDSLVSQVSQAARVSPDLNLPPALQTPEGTSIQIFHQASG